MRRTVLFALTAILLLSLPVRFTHAAHFAEPSSSSASVTVSLTATVGGSPLAVDDEVAVYSVHPRPGVPNKWERTLVGHAVAAGAGLMAVTAYGDDPSTTGVVEGAAPGEELCLALWRASESREYTAYTTPAGLPVTVAWTSDGDSLPVDLDFREGQRIPLRMGAWNLISYGILSGYYRGASPPGPPVAGSQLSGVAWDNVAALGDAFPLKSIEGKVDRVVGNDGKGNKLWISSIPASTLAYLAPGYGYWVRMKAGSAPLSWMTVPGSRATLSETLSLSAGWTLLGYWDTGRVYHASTYDASWELVPVDASPVPLVTLGEVWGSLGSSYDRMVSFDGGGNKLYLPSLPGPSTMKYLAPGYGYWGKMLAPVTLSYPPPFPPPIVLTLDATGLGRDNTVLAGSVNPNGGSTTAWFEWGTSPTLATYDNTTSQAVGSGLTPVTVNAPLAALVSGTTYYYRVAASNAAGMSQGDILSFTTSEIIPPDPGSVAPPVTLGESTTLYAASGFLYTGTDPIQTGVAPGTIALNRAAVLRGKVTTREGADLSGVRVTVLGHPEFGQTLSRADGMFDLAVNGGGVLTVAYDRTGYLPVQRQVNAPWQDYAWLPDVALIPLDPQVTAIDLSSPAPIQVARGSVSTDANGSRQATLLFPQGTTAQMVMPDNTTVPITTLRVRATEYTVGPNGPKAMPAALPPSSAYTYCVELSVDEAIAAGAKRVSFSAPVIQYVENFIGFPVGTAVPVGYYDREAGVWVASPNGRVIEVLGVTLGLADLDTDGDGAVDNAAVLAALGVTDAERAQLASLYATGTSLWRVPISHFTPWDANWPYGPPMDAVFPPSPNPSPGPNPGPGQDGSGERPDCEEGSLIECQNQVLGESVAVPGTPFRLHYRSNRVPGDKRSYTVTIPLSGSSIPASLRAIGLQITLAGRLWDLTFAAAPNQTYTLEWDGRDGYGRSVEGRQRVTAKIAYRYLIVYYPVMSDFEKCFARVQGLSSAGGNPGIGFDRLGASTPMERTWVGWIGSIGTQGARGQSAGGWSLSPHHAYDVGGRTLYLGRGSLRGVQGRTAEIITTVAGNGVFGFSGDGGPATGARLYESAGIAVGPDGSLYIADTYNYRIRRVGPDGFITTVAGNGVGGFGGDGGPATAASLGNPNAVSVAPDGSLYIAEYANHRIRRVGVDGIITTVAGNGVFGFSGDGGPATAARIYNPRGVSVSPDGSLYIADYANHRIRRVGPDANISTVAGNGVRGYSGDGGPATAAALRNPSGVSVAPDGSLYIADYGNHRIRRVGVDGIITTVAGNGGNGFSGDGGPATSAMIYNPYGIAVAADGSLLIADFGTYRIRRVGPDGIIATLAGNGIRTFSGDGGSATAASMDSPFGVAAAPDGSFYISDGNNNRIRRVSPPLPGASMADLSIASADGDEVYRFSGSGRHLATRNAVTGETRYQFAYDNAGLLSQITDGDGNVTTVERSAGGDPTAIVGPFGHRTALAVDNGYLSSVTAPSGEATGMAYAAEGLLIAFTDPKGNVSRITYDAMGRLTKDEDPAGGSWSLSRTGGGDDTRVSVASAMGRTTTYREQRLPTGARQSTMTTPTGALSGETTGTDGTVQAAGPTGMTSTETPGPDPRFGMQAPVAKSVTIRTPSGLTATLSTTRSATLSSPSDPFSATALWDNVIINGNTYIGAYDVSLKRFGITTPAGRQWSSTIDNQGRTLSLQAAPALSPLTHSYDARGRLVQAAWGDRQVAYAYDSLGRLESRTDASGNGIRYAYDGADRISAVTLPSGRIYGFGFDAAGNPTQVTMPTGSAHALGYTPVNLDNSYAPPGNPEYTWGYSLDRERVRTGMPGGRVVNSSFDAGGRFTGMTYPEATVGIEYAVGDNTTRASRLVWSPAGGGTAQQIADSYDGILVTSRTFSGVAQGQFQYGYDNGFLVKQVRFAGSTDNVTRALTRDADGLVTAYGPFTWTRGGPLGALTGIQDGNLSVAVTYDTQARASVVTHSVNGAQIRQFQFAYDNTGRQSQMAETVSGTPHTYDYAYDVDGQLTGVTKDGLVVETYGYDANGNRTLRQDGSAPALVAAYDNQDRIVSQGGISYTFSSDGFLTGRGTDTFTYSARGELLGATTAGGTVTYAYDGFGRRVGRSDTSGTTQYLYGNPENDLEVTAIRDSSGVLTFFHYDAGGRLFAMDRGGVRHYVVSDLQRSPRVVVDNTGTVVKAVEYDGYGNVLSDSNPAFALPLAFAGGLWDDATALVRFGLRDYDPGSGRWVTRDPALYAGRQANLFAYVNNDPVNFADPFGLVSLKVSAYMLLGGGLEIGATSEGFSVCGEGGVGIGESVEFDPTGGLAQDRSSIVSEVSAKLGIAGGKLALETGITDDCETVTPQICVGPLCTKGNNLSVKGKPENLGKNLSNLLKNSGAGLQAKTAYKSCMQIKW